MEPAVTDIHSHLIRKSLAGDARAQMELYQRYNKAMFNTCIRLVGNREDAEDVLQDSFIQAFTRLSSFRGESTFGAWLKRIVVNTSLNHIKKRKLQLEILDETDKNFIEPVQDDIHIKWNLDQIRKAVELLPEGFRLVFSLYMIEGYDHQEISEILKITESTSKSQLNRAKKKLREILIQTQEWTN